MPGIPLRRVFGRAFFRDAKLVRACAPPRQFHRSTCAHLNPLSSRAARHHFRLLAPPYAFPSIAYRIHPVRCFSQSSSQLSSPRPHRTLLAASLGLGLVSLLTFGCFGFRAQAESRAEDPGKSRWVPEVVSNFWTSQRSPIREQLLPSDSPLDALGNPIYTVVVALEKTLMCSTYSRDKGWTHVKRPCADQFLLALARLGFEVVVFSSEYKGSVIGMSSTIDPRQCVQHWLFREHTTYDDGVHVKDLSLLGRDLSRVVLVDSNPEAFKHHPDSGITVTPYSKVDENDRELCKLISFFKHLKREGVEDVREVLRNFDEFQAHAEELEKERAKKSKEKKSQQRRGWFW